MNELPSAVWTVWTSCPRGGPHTSGPVIYPIGVIAKDGRNCVAGKEMAIHHLEASFKFVLGSIWQVSKSELSANSDRVIVGELVAKLILCAIYFTAKVQVADWFDPTWVISDYRMCQNNHQIFQHEIVCDWPNEWRSGGAVLSGSTHNRNKWSFFPIVTLEFVFQMKKWMPEVFGHFRPTMPCKLKAAMLSKNLEMIVLYTYSLYIKILQFG